jgi:hypothetical protein
MTGKTDDAKRSTRPAFMSERQQCDVGSLNSPIADGRNGFALAGLDPGEGVPGMGRERFVSIRSGRAQWERND